MLKLIDNVKFIFGSELFVETFTKHGTKPVCPFLSFFTSIKKTSVYKGTYLRISFSFDFISISISLIL